MTSTIRSKRSNTHSDLSSKIFSKTKYSICFIDIDASHDPHPFLRMQMLNFQVDDHQYINLKDIQIQIELKEKHRTARDTTESKISMKQKGESKRKYFRTSSSQISIVH